MEKTNKNLLILNGIFITSLLIANVVSAKIVTFGGLVIPAAIAGGSWSFGLPNGFISLSPLYRYDFGPNTHAIQLSNCYLANWKWCELYGYNHTWYNGGFCFFGEERFHVKITQNLMIGAILDITHFGVWDATISVGIRYDL